MRLYKTQYEWSIDRELHLFDQNTVKTEILRNMIQFNKTIHTISVQCHTILQRSCTFNVIKLRKRASSKCINVKVNMLILSSIIFTINIKVENICAA